MCKVSGVPVDYGAGSCVSPPIKHQSSRKSKHPDDEFAL